MFSTVIVSPFFFFFLISGRFITNKRCWNVAKNRFQTQQLQQIQCYHKFLSKTACCNMYVYGLVFGLMKDLFQRCNVHSLHLAELTLICYVYCKCNKPLLCQSWSMFREMRTSSFFDETTNLEISGFNFPLHTVHLLIRIQHSVPIKL